MKKPNNLNPTLIVCTGAALLLSGCAGMKNSKTTYELTPTPGVTSVGERTPFSIKRNWQIKEEQRRKGKQAGSPSHLPPTLNPPPIINTPPTGTVEELPEPPKVKLMTYTVKKGDTLGHIAKAHRVSIGELAALNDMNRNSVLHIGAKLTLPASAQKPKRPPHRLGDRNHKMKYYTVQKGDVLSRIAKRTGTKVVDIKKWNKLSSDKIFIGQKLALGPNAKVTPPRKRTVVESKTGMHVVQPGESLSVIAKRYGLSVATIKKLNNLKSDKIMPDQKLKLRDGAKVAGTPANKPGTAKPKQPEGSTKKKAADRILLPHFVDQARDTLKSIAQMYNSKVAWILQANPKIKKDEDLKLVKEIQVPIPNQGLR